MVHPHIEQVHAALIFAVVPAHIRSRPLGLHHDSDTMELGVAGMKDVTRHLFDRGAEEAVERPSQIRGNRLG